MTGTALLHDDTERWLRREVAVGTLLAERTHLAVAPTDILPPGPHEHDGLWMTMWDFVPHDDEGPPPQPRELGRSLRRLHAALAGFPGDLAPLSEIRDWLERLRAGLRPTPALTRRDIDRLGIDLETLSPTVFESSLVVQPLRGHGSGYVDRLVAGYGDPSIGDLQPFLEAHALYDRVWQAFVLQES